MRHDWSLLVSLALCVAASVGCGSKYDVVPVQGTLTFDGQPVPEMIVRFQPSVGRASEAITAADGSFVMGYTLDESGVEIDSHQVTVAWSPPTDERNVKPSELQQKVLGDFKAKGPLEVTIESAERDFQIKLPR